MAIGASVRRAIVLGALVAVVALVVLAAVVVFRVNRHPETTTGTTGRAPLSAAECLARPDTVRLTGRRATNFWDRRPADDKTYDLRGLVSTAYGNDVPPFPISIGIKTVVADAPDSPLTMGNDPGARTCVIGGTVLGQIPRELTWGEVKRGSD
ncbi:MAG: hypothetical protein ACM3ZF_08855, partial [Mycobacterium leprae]